MDGSLLNIDDAIAALNAVDPVQQPQQQQQEVEQQPSSSNDDDTDDEEEAVSNDDNAQLELSVASVAPEHPCDMYYRNMLLNKKRKPDEHVYLSNEMLVDQGITYLHWHALYTKNCPHPSRKKGKFMSCSCMSYYQEDVTADDDSTTNLTMATALFIAHFAKQNKAAQQQYVMFSFCIASREHSKGKKKTYDAPVLSDLVNNIVIRTPPKICMSAMQIITGKKMGFWRTCMNAVQNNTLPTHGLVGRPSNNNKFTEETLDDLHAYFLGEIKAFCDVIPT
jgi:hypothetical protein